MEQMLFTEYRTLFISNREHPHVIRLRIRMRDLIDPIAMRWSVDQTMKRYPYFCVELKCNENNHYYFAENDRPVTISRSMQGVDLNTADSNFHMIAFSWSDNWVTMDISHAVTDGKGAYEIIRTFLYYYCSKRYNVALSEEGIRLAEDEISPEEWINPVMEDIDLPEPGRVQFSKALDLVEAGRLGSDWTKTVYNITIDEDEFMRFNVENDGSPATMTALFLSRAIAKLYPEAEDSIRICVAVNQRIALKKPLAHQNLVGGAFLEYKDKMRDWPLDRQATAFRGMVFAQTQEEKVLAAIASQKRIAQMMMSMTTDKERAAMARQMDKMASSYMCACVSYVGKADYKEAEQYVRDFRTWTSSTGDALLVEISAVNGKFSLDFIQPFFSPLYVNAFLSELEENGITYDLQDVRHLELPNVKLPWTRF